jgi:hypothetical protein
MFLVRLGTWRIFGSKKDVVERQRGRDMKKRSEEPGTDPNAANARDHVGAKDWLCTEIAAHGNSTTASEEYRRDELLLLLAQRIGRLPPGSKKILAMYYHENLSVPGIATYFDLPGWRITEILTQTVCLLRNDLPKFRPMKPSRSLSTPTVNARSRPVCWPLP